MLVRSSLVQYNKDTCLVKYTASISLEQKERIKNCNMPISVTVGNNVIKGNIESISQSFSMATGLFELVASIKVPEYIIPEIIQYQDNTILTINISDKTIFNKVFLTDKIYE